MAAEQIGKSSLKVATLTLLGGCMIFAGATHAIAQKGSQASPKSWHWTNAIQSRSTRP